MEHDANARLYPTAEMGLSAQQVNAQIARGLVNTKPKSAQKTVGEIIRDNTLTLFNLFNVAIAVAVFLVGAYRNLLFMAVIVANTLIGIVQEIRSKRLVEKLSLVSAPRVTVVRGGERAQVLVEALVRDDVVELEAGRQIGADAVILRGEIEVNEALLTGEADPVFRREGERVLSGSFVVGGRCRARVEHIGEDNYAAAIEKDAKKGKRPRSALLASLERVVKFTSAFILPLGAVLMARALFLLKLPMRDAVSTTAAALLGMMPKGLVLLTSVSLAVGVIRLAKARTLVHELYGIESLSRVDMLCMDKTGTITEGRLRVSEWVPLFGAIPRQAEADIGAFAHAQTDNNGTVAAVRAHFTRTGDEGVHVVPFSSARRYSAVTFSDRGSIVMGAPETLWRAALGDMPAQLEALVHSGARVLLFARSARAAADGLPEDLVPFAAVALRDEIRGDAKRILDFFRREGVMQKIISGDNPHTLRAVARAAGMAGAEDAVDVSTIDDEAALRQAATRYSVFGRANPQQKRVLIQALKDAGHTVAMMGDGVNDVLALRAADCSIAMASGTDAARFISQIVLLNDDFASLPAVVMEGRRVVNNITRTASLYLVKTVYSSLISFITVFSAFGYPFIPVQLTLIGVLMEGIPSLVLALEENRARIQGSFFAPVLGRAVPCGFAIAALVALTNVIAAPLGWDARTTNTLCVYLTGIFCAILLGVVCRPFNRLRGVLWAGMTAAFFAIAAGLPRLFELTILNAALAQWLFALTAAGVLLMWLCHKAIEKLWMIAERTGHTHTMQEGNWT